ncbi:hypothetical protein NXC24_CH00481 [Rhizobium sp. NXC24]|nr:hypothetical protein NXC24_CH00481 [Rhizobium sp. NXC24]
MRARLSFVKQPDAGVAIGIAIPEVISQMRRPRLLALPRPCSHITRNRVLKDQVRKGRLTPRT